MTSSLGDLQSLGPQPFPALHLPRRAGYLAAVPYEAPMTDTSGDSAHLIPANARLRRSRRLWRVLFFLALFTSLVSMHTAGQVKVIYVGSMSLMLFAWFALVSVFFTTPSVRQGFFRFGRWFNRVTGITFLVLAVRVAIAQQH